MDPVWIKVLLSIGGLLIALVSTLIAQFFRMSNDTAELKTHLAEHYVSKEEFRNHTDRLERQMEVGFNRLYTRLNSGKDGS